MKKSNFFSLLSLGLLLLSCQSDKTEIDYTQKNNLLGTWVLSQIGTSNAANGIDYIFNHEANVCGTDIDNLVFNSDMTYSNTNYDGNSGNCLSENISGIYSLKNHYLKFTYNDEDGVSQSKTFLVTKLSNMYLEVNYTDSFGKLIWLEFKKN